MIAFKRSDGPPDYKAFIDRHCNYIYAEQTIRSAVLYDENTLATVSNLATEIMNIRSNDTLYNLTSRSTVLDFLLQYCGVNKDDLMYKGAISLGKNTLPNIIKHPLAGDFVREYLEFNSLQAKVSKMSNLINMAERVDKVSSRGVPLLKWPYKMEERSTGRVYASDINYQNIAREYLPHICEEKGRALISCDFSAFEVTIQYYLTYRTPELDEGFLLCEDPYEFMYYVTNSNGKEFTREFRKKWKQPFLAAVYGQHPLATTDQLGDADVANNLHKWLEGNEKRSNYLSKISNQYDKKGFVTAKTYWGRLLSSQGDKETTKSSILNRFANIPIQGTGHDIVAKYGLEVIRRFEEAGIPSDDVYFMMSRHDEPVFSVPMDYLEKAVAVMEDSTLVQIDDWRPLRVTANFQLYYTQTELAVEPPTLTLDEIRSIQTSKSNYFCPLRECYQLRIGHYATMDIEGNPIYMVYGYSLNTSRIQAKIFQDYSTMKHAIDAIVYNTIVDSPNDDLEIITTIPITTMLSNTFKMIKEEGFGTDIQLELTSALSTDMTIIGSLLNKANLLDKVVLPFRPTISDYNIEPIDINVGREVS